jgi:DNA-binding NtrC family response regulator
MPPLLRDRYLMIDPTRACDLATGDVVSIDGLTEHRHRRQPSLPALLEVLDHGRDGEPRAIVASLNPRVRWKATVDRVAADAADRGYVPIDVAVYTRLRSAIQDDIADRTLMLITGDRQAACARAALLDAAAWSPRPHVLLAIHVGGQGAGAQVREARAAYGPVDRRSSIAVVSADVQRLLQRSRRAPEFVAAGRHAAAERLLREISAALMRRSAWPHAISAQVDLGRLLLERGRAADAVPVFCEAVAAATSAGDARLAAEARIWLATARTDAGELTAAESICRSLLLVGGLPPSLSAWTRAALIRVLLWQDRTHDALGFAATPVNGLDDLDAGTRTFVLATEIRLLLRAGRMFEAGVRANELMMTCSATSPVGRVMALTSHLRVLAAAGDLTAAAARLQNIAEASRVARTPLRLLRARLVWIDALRRAGRARDADRELGAAARLGRAAPLLLHNSVQQRLGVPEASVSLASASEPRLPVTSDRDVSAAAFVRLAHEEDDDGRAVARVLEAAACRLRSTRIDLWSRDAGPVTLVWSSGTGLPSTIGGRVIDAGIVIGPDNTDPPTQLGVPIRMGVRLVAAVVARWPLDRVPPEDARSTLELMAAVIAPRVDALLHRARTEAEAATLIPELVGISRAITDVRQAVARAAAAPFSVLVEGESGVGKELIARAVHYLSPRRERRFCDVNCAAIPDELLESELFGHTKGAFTGAVADRVGLFEEAHGGTLFLDEIADLSPRAQAKLLRVLQQQEVRRVGETFARPVDVRLVAAANRDMRTEAANGRFRQDLLYRVDVIRIDVPALRERPEDIPALAQHFWRTASTRVGTAASLSPSVLAALSTYHWPGNVRELQNVIAALAVAAPRRGRLSADLLPGVISGAMPVCTSRLADARTQFERRFVEVALARMGGNRARAARALGLSRQGLLKLIERLQIDK